MGFNSNVSYTALIVYFLLLTFCFFVKRMTMTHEKINGPLIILFFLASGLVQFVTNLGLTAQPQLCGVRDTQSAFISTLIPWLFVFGISCLSLIYIPGWLRIFSNTIGHSFVKNVCNLDDTINAIFTKRKDDNSEDITMITGAVNLLYANRSHFINEINLDYKLENDIVSWPSLDKVLEFMNIVFTSDEKQSLYINLYKTLIIKEDVGYFLWLWLIGSITVLISTNTLLLNSCNGQGV